MKIKNQHAFTLMELMVTLAIVAITMTIAVPAMNDFVKNERLTSYTNTLLTDLILARSTAVERNQPVIVCVSSSQTACTAGAYADGWIVIVDTNSDGSGTAADEVIKVQQAITGDINFISSVGDEILFDGRGFNPGAVGIISVCDDRGVERANTLSISRTGRVSRGAAPVC
jgi:type IV fimbrial biogenesis protein FimT